MPAGVVLPLIGTNLAPVNQPGRVNLTSLPQETLVRLHDTSLMNKMAYAASRPTVAEARGGVPASDPDIGFGNYGDSALIS